MSTSIPEGSTFLLPRPGRPDGFAVVARRVPRGRIVAVYLFSQAPKGAEPGHPFTLPEPGRADARAKLVDYALRDGTWTALGVHPQFVRDEWPFAEVVHYERGRVSVLSVDDRNPTRVVAERPGSLDDLELRPSLNLLIPEDTERLLDKAARD